MSKEPPGQDQPPVRNRRGRDPYNTSEKSPGIRKRVRSGPIELFRRARDPGQKSGPLEDEERVKLEVTDYEERETHERGLDPYNTTTLRRPKFRD